MLLTLTAMLATQIASAFPTRDEVYRSDKLKTIVYKDETDPRVFWYVPPIKLLEEQGKIVYYKKAKGTAVNYYFYIVPTMNNDLVEFLAREIGNATTYTQFKPVIAKKFGIQVKEYDVVAMSDEVTDYQYLNNPHLIKFSMDATDSKDFEFFLNHVPGVQANVMITFTAQRTDKYCNIDLRHHEVYKALNIGVTGQYSFTGAQIANAVSKYLADKSLTQKCKGDMKIPDVVNQVIKEMFTPVTIKGKNDGFNNGDWWNNWGSGGNDNWPYDNGGSSGNADDGASPLSSAGLQQLREKAATNKETEKQLNEMKSIADFALAVPSKLRFTDNGLGDLSSFGGGPGNPGDPTPPRPNGNGVMFQFKRELAKSNQSFNFNSVHVVDDTETTLIPVYLSLIQNTVNTKTQMVTKIAKRDFVVDYKSTANRPFSTGIIVKENEQYIVDVNFAISAANSFYFGTTPRWFKPSVAGDNVSQNLYYRIGDSPWQPVDTKNAIDKRLLIRQDSIYHGELQFYVDRQGVWNGISKDLTEAKGLGLIPAVMNYNQTYPQFNIVVSGRKYNF